MTCLYFFYIRAVHLDTIKVFYSATNIQVIVLKTILKLTLKQLRHVSVQSHHYGVTAPKHVGAVLMSILILFFKTITCAFVGE